MNNETFIWKKFAIILLVGLLPLLLLFGYFELSPKSYFFDYFLDLTQSINANISSTNLELTKPLSIYCKLSPLFALYFVFKFGKYIKLKEGKKKSTLAFNFIGFSLVYIILLYIFAIGEFDITNGNRLLKATASNDYAMFLYYIVTFSGLYCLSFLFFLMLAKIPSIISKGRLL